MPSHVEGQPAQHEDLLAGGIGEVREEALSHVSLHDAHGHGGEKKGGEDVHEEDVALRVYVGHGAGLVRTQVVDPPVVDVDGQDDDEHEEGDGGHVGHDVALHAEEGEPVRAVLPHHVGAVQPQPAGAEGRNLVPIPSRESSLGLVRLERVDQSEPPLPLLPRVELCALLAQQALQVVPDEEEGDQHDEDQKEVEERVGGKPAVRTQSWLREDGIAAVPLEVVVAEVVRGIAVVQVSGGGGRRTRHNTAESFKISRFRPTLF